MAEETAVAAPSAAPTFTQFDGWSDDGTPIVREQPKPKADPAPADKPEQKASDDAADSAAKPTQEKPKRRPDVEERFKTLTDERNAAKAEADRLRRELEEARRPKETKADSSTAKPEQPQNYQDWRKTFKAKEWVEKYLADHPNESYEEANAAMSDFLGDVRDQFRSLEQRVSQQRESAGKQLEEARGRYENFDSIAKPIIEQLLKPDVPRELFAVINDSPVLPDLLYVIGGTEQSKADFLEAAKSNPSKALRMALLIEQEIVNEKNKVTKTEKKEEEPPAQAKPRAPKPPSEVGGRGAVSEDSLVSAAKANDFRSFEQEQTRRALASRR